MTDRPILFSAPMVRALLADRKTQTRRILSGLGDQPIVEYDGMFMWREGYRWGAVTNPKFPPGVRCKVGDRLYVREAWKAPERLDTTAPRDIPKGTSVYFVADDRLWPVARYRQAMHMPRWASRLMLTVTDVRVERLQAISDDDAIAEGIEYNPRLDPVGQCKWRHYGRESAGIYPPSASYMTLWDSINGHGSSDADPWVVAYTFTVQRGNIDQIARAA
ncbi:MAG: hypothetical protein ACJ8EW_04130 [Rhizobium sp.]|uniref:hypothetical protein n=1 Tax=Rhizobium sp. TaxID=391 RepID=UPI003899AB67